MFSKKIIFAFALLVSLQSVAQSYIPAYQSRANMVSQTNINTLLQDIENLGVKTTGSVANNNALLWLKNKYLSFGYTASQVQEIPFSYATGSGNVNSTNLVVTKTGTVYPNIFVIVCGHYDSIVGPGVDDNGSGVASILEIARILKDVPTEYSIKFINFSGEEQGLKGSYNYVANVVNATNPKMNIKVVFNLDQVGGKIGNNNNTIYCDQDQGGLSSNNAASQAMTQQLANCTALYSPLLTAFDPAYASDYIPFEQNGEVITGYYEYIRSYTEHTTNDTYANVDIVYVKNVAMAATGAVQHFAVAQTTLSTKESAMSDNDANFYPIPTTSLLNIDFVKLGKENFLVEIYDMSGKLVISEFNKKQINVSGLENGVYLAKLTVGDKIYRKKIVIKK
ncbi:MAG: M20/M25/M40 family metallo-hydrolase [Bacteroidetes bacterium]|nr:M20/M25/M40 family metallo-hydrolase [Bacteroidota bacterium]